MKKSYFITTSIPYVNAPPHIGFALELLYTDCVARFHRLSGEDVLFTTGADEHGQKIARKAEELGVTPQIYTDQISQMFRDLAISLGASSDDFIRTTDPRHVPSVNAFWRTVRENGFIYKKTYAGLYCVGCESFKTEKDLVDGKCPDHLKDPEYIEDENYFFKLSAFQSQLSEWYASHPEWVIPDTRFNEAKQLVESGLEDVSISRSIRQLTWGIPVPDDEDQVIYVWFDALINYLTVCGFGVDDERFQKYWAHATHVIGKDINRFHVVLWPAMLLAAGIPLPEKIAVHGWIHHDGQKMSKSLGNVIEWSQVSDLFTRDGARYLFLRDVPFRGDGDYTEARYRERCNSDLANNLGNLVNRVTSMTKKYCDGKIPPMVEGNLDDVWNTYASLMQEWKFDLALESVWKIFSSLNQDIDESKPWALAKEGKTDELQAKLYTWLESIRIATVMLLPVMPESAESILNAIGSSVPDSFEDAKSWGGLASGTMLPEPVPLFPRK